MTVHDLNNADISPHIGIIGGGISGATIALRLAEIGIKVTVFEKESSVINGPPICHLHAGGNLYPDIPIQQCLALLKQSIDTLKVFKHSINIRPTVIALPKSYKLTPEQLEPRLKLIQAEYAALVTKDVSNEVLGPVEDYYRFYSQEQLKLLSYKTTPTEPSCLDDWMIPLAKNMDFNQLQFPILMVQEYGLSVFRLAATVDIAAEQFSSCDIRTNTEVINIKRGKKNKSWDIVITDQQKFTETISVDYLINACGFKTGEVDDLLNIKRDRMVEFKAAYLAYWEQCQGQWPEVIFYGERGTPKGMAQLTPCTNGYFQLHGMTEEITLFKGGLVSTHGESAQPKLGKIFLNKIYGNWPAETVVTRTEKSIQHVGQYIPAFNRAVLGGNPLFGAQQIPGVDRELRVADVIFTNDNYACIEIVKGSSALDAANLIVNKLIETKKLSELTLKLSLNIIQSHYFPITQSISSSFVKEKAVFLAKERNYPIEMV